MAISITGDSWSFISRALQEGNKQEQRLAEVIDHSLQATRLSDEISITLDTEDSETVKCVARKFDIEIKD